MYSLFRGGTDTGNLNSFPTRRSSDLKYGTIGQNGVGLINQGTISCDVNGGTLGLAADPFVNQAVLEGANGGTLGLSGTFTPANLGTVHTTTGTVSFTGTIDNTGNTLD